MRRTIRGKKIQLSDHRAQLAKVERRLFLKQGLSLGALTWLGGCDMSQDSLVDRLLWSMSRWNDRAQAALFNPDKLAPTYTSADITDPFPFNAYYSESRAPVVDGAAFKLEVSGMVTGKRSWTLDELRQLPQQSQITRHICVEGWSAIGKWSGVPFRAFLERAGADMKARYVGFRCADDYHTSIDMATALHPQTILALDFAGAELPVKYGYPMKLRIPTKLGFKNPKHIAALYVTNDYPGGYWEDQGYNWFSGS